MRSLHLAGLMLLAVVMASCAPKSAPLSGSTVKIVMGESSHGSGVHIGDGYILTAAHVVPDVAQTTIKADDGSLRPASVLWINKAYDVALLRLDKPAPITASSLACREPREGEMLHAKGSPGNVEFVTTWGRVSGASRKHGIWESAVVFDATVAPGMSGGPVLDTTGKVVGITVGIMVVPIGFGASLIPVSYIVPASAICMLMGR